MITAILALALICGTPSTKTAPIQPALHTKTAVYDLTNKKRK